MNRIVVKVFTAALISVVAVVGTAFAQEAPAGKKGKPGRQREARGAARMLKELDLTAEQKEKIKAIQDAQRAKVQPIRDNKTLTEEQKKEQMRPIAKETMTKILEILTPEQKSKMQELRNKMKEQRGQRGGAAKP